MKKRLLGLLLLLCVHVRAGDVFLRADHYSSNLDTKITTCEGNAVVEFDDKRMGADVMVLHDLEGKVEATGNVKFQQGALRLNAKRADMDIKTGIGTYYESLVDLKDTITMEGRKIIRLSATRYEVEDGKISFCQNCPQDWSIIGSRIEVEIEAFMQIHHAIIQAKDVPIAYIPYFAFPIKTKRQSGFLIPRYFNLDTNLKNTLEVPYYWAIDRSSDALVRTRFTQGGIFGASAYRKAFDDRSYLIAEPGYLRYTAKSPLTGDLGKHRYGFHYEDKWQISPTWTQRLYGNYVSDPYYTSDIYKDFDVERRLPTLVTENSISHTGTNTFAYGLVQYHEKNNPLDPTVAAAQTYLGNIQTLPELGFSIPSYDTYFGRSSLDLGYVNFYRGHGEIDPSSGWIRSGGRTTIAGRFISPVYLGDLIKWEPSVDLRTDAYQFYASSLDSSAARARLVLDQVFSTEFAKIFRPDFPDLKAIRHSMTPFVELTYSPNELKTKHPFFDNQTPQTGKFLHNSPRFDIFDPNSELARGDLNRSDEIETKLVPHAYLIYGLRTKLVGRYGDTSRTYTQFFEAGVRQEYNLEYVPILDAAGNPVADNTGAFGPLRIDLNGGYGGFAIRNATSIYLSRGNATVDLGVSYGFSHYGVSMGTIVGRDQNNAVVRVYSVGASVAAIGNWSAATNFALRNDPNRGDKVRPYHHDFRIDYLDTNAKCWYFSLMMVKEGFDNAVYNYEPKVGLTVNESVKGKFF